MNEFYDSIISRHVKSFDIGIQRVHKKRQEWNNLADRCTIIFESVKKEAEHQSLFEKLYIFDSRKAKNFDKKPPFVQFSFGAYPLGYEQFTTNELVIEKNCSLNINLDATGGVTCILYPFSSELLKREENFLICKIVESPSSLKNSDIEEFVKHLFSYAQLSSVFGKPSFCDKISLYILKIRHWWIYFNLEKIIPKFIETATTASVRILTK
jgi:hypothetical protein